MLLAVTETENAAVASVLTRLAVLPNQAVAEPNQAVAEPRRAAVALENVAAVSAPILHVAMVTENAVVASVLTRFVVEPKQAVAEPNQAAAGPRKAAAVLENVAVANAPILHAVMVTENAAAASVLTRLAVGLK